MALQVDKIRVIGSYNSDDLVGYIKNGEHRMMVKPDISAERFWKHADFAGSRRSANRMAEASRLASKLYRGLAKEKRHHLVYKELTGIAFVQLKKGSDPETIDDKMLKRVSCFDYGALPLKQKKTRRKKAFPFAIEITDDYVLVNAIHLEYLEDKYEVEQVELMAAEAIVANRLAVVQKQRRKTGARRSCLRSKEAAQLITTAYDFTKKIKRPLLLYFNLKSLSFISLRKKKDKEHILEHLHNYKDEFMRLYHSEGWNVERNEKLLEDYTKAA